ncbi:MAG: guanylate kinase [Clostridiales bacterium]|nr:guanylate kinase [Clostridiales bacterium]
MNQRGILTVISGFSGAGKGTLIRELLARYPERYALSVSATTRSPRPGEENGREYFFVTKEEFEKRIREGGLIEYAQYVENYYGTPKAYVDAQLEAGKNVILEIEVQGALKVKEKFPDTLLLFVTPPDAAELESRLRGRGTESEEVIQNRLRQASWEASFMSRYDYILVNDKLEICVEELHALIASQKLRMSANSSFITQMKTELEKYQG